MVGTTCAFTGHRPHKFPWKDNEADPRCIALKETLAEQIAAQSDVADRLEVTRATISGYECNTITPSVEQLVKLAVLYNTSLDYMLGMENRSYLYLDDLSESQQKTILDVVDRLKKEFLNPL